MRIVILVSGAGGPGFKSMKGPASTWLTFIIYFINLRYPSTNSDIVISPSPSTSSRSKISLALILALSREKSWPACWEHNYLGLDFWLISITLGSCSTPSTSSMVAMMLVISFRLIQPLSSTSHILEETGRKIIRYIFLTLRIWNRCAVDTMMIFR